MATIMIATVAVAKYDTTGLRFAAGILDGLVLMPIGFADVLIFTQQIVWLSIAWIPISYSAYWLYSVIAHGLYGKTLGKHVMKVIVLDNETETRISWKQAILRDIFLIVVTMISVVLDIYIVAIGITELSFTLQVISQTLAYGAIIWFVTEIVTCLANSKRRALHDFIAGTVVVKAAQ